MYPQSSESLQQPESAEISDPLAGIISLLRPQTIFSKIVSGAGEWSIRYARYENPAYCIVLNGSCFLDADGIGILELEAGDFVFFPETPSFNLAADLNIKPLLVSPTHSHDIRHGDQFGPVTMRMLGGYFQIDRANAPLLVKLLPPVVHIRHKEAEAGRLRRIVELIAEEADTHRPGRDFILERLVQVLLVEALRSRPISAARQERGLLAGLSDPGLARALHEIHGDVTRKWTVAELAGAAHMSRSGFAERFARRVGMPPMHYLLEWRMALAKDLLNREQLPLADVAKRIGYQSASAFSTAFSRLTGCSPSEFANSTG